MHHDPETPLPIDIYTGPRLLNPQTGVIIPAGFDVTSDLDLAMTLENAQYLPDGFCIWQDRIAQAQSPFYSLAETQAPTALIEAKSRHLISQWDLIETSPLRSTEFGQFWKTVSFDICEQLKICSVGRIVLGDRVSDLLTKIAVGYDCGYYPCGLRTSGTMMMFDPRALDGYAECRSFIAGRA